MKPIVKYQGGKSKELKRIVPLLPEYTRMVEPFAGGAAVAFNQEKDMWLNDINTSLINLYRVVAGDMYYDLQSAIAPLYSMEHDDLSREFYEARDVINNTCVDSVLWAKSYIVVRQLCYSGMERYNSSGAFNVPFGHYKKFACYLSDSHHDLLSRATVTLSSAVDVINDSVEGDFLFIDPPYMDRAGYTNGDGGDLHVDLHSALSDADSPWMIVHSDNDFYRDMYSGYMTVEKDFQYAQRWGSGDYQSKVKHLYITNY